MRSSLIAAAIIAISSSADASAQMYRWMDSEGRVHYTQTPPPPNAKNAEQKNLGAGNTAAAINLPYATRVAQQNFPVTLYTSPACGAPCEQARALLVKRTVPFREVSVTEQEQFDQVKKISGGAQLPVLTVGSQIQVGFLESAYIGLLDTAGYPASGPSLSLEALRKMDAPKPAAPAPAPASNTNAADTSAANTGTAK